MTLPYFCFLKYGHAALAHYVQVSRVNAPTVPSQTNLIGSFHVNLDDQIPVGISHILEADIPQNARVV